MVGRKSKKVDVLVSGLYASIYKVGMGKSFVIACIVFARSYCAAFRWFSRRYGEAIGARNNSIHNRQLRAGIFVHAHSRSVRSLLSLILDCLTPYSPQRGCAVDTVTPGLRGRN